ncbi:MAG: hypothetical protein HC880_10070 [Bacteroidia bacterium]|nr:hypothetical protein [Bacteroidia bacterium]
MKATLFVLIIKALVSPHTPLPAYLAVSFQGVMGALIFSQIQNMRLAAYVLAVIALMEAAIQKILIMTLLFGHSLWKAADAFVSWVLQQFGWIAQGEQVEGAWWLISTYLGIYFISGLVVGYLAGQLPRQIVQAQAARLNRQSPEPALPPLIPAGAPASETGPLADGGSYHPADSCLCDKSVS